MTLNFTKMHGCGNDYIFVFCFDIEIDNPERLADELSDRYTGVGSDGLVLILRSDVADAKMRMFNADGSEAGMCGNAIRCVAKYLYDNNIIKKPRMRIETASGVRELKLFITGGYVTSATVNMGRAILEPSKIPVSLTGDSVISRPATFDRIEYKITCVSMGNPHAVLFCPDVYEIYLGKVGPAIENDPLFPERTNVEFVKVEGGNQIRMRVWERGTGETLACGTGACAAAVASVLNGHCGKGEDIKVMLTGGDLTVKYTDEAVYLTGDCVKVFDGFVEI